MKMKPLRLANVTSTIRRCERLLNEGECGKSILRINTLACRAISAGIDLSPWKKRLAALDKAQKKHIAALMEVQD